MANRTRVAQFLAERLATGADRKQSIRAAAAWLVTQHKTRDARYLARDTAAALGAQGYVYARVTTARPLSPTSRAAIERYLKERLEAKTLELEELTDPTVLGGVKLDLPTARLDATIRRQLTAFIEGAVR